MHGRLLAILASGLILAGAARAAPVQIESRYTPLEPCREIGHMNPKEDVDFVSYRCRGWPGIPVWLTYTDSTKSHLGFGPRENVSGMFGIDRGRAWRLEWRGVVERGAFRPFAVIVRANRPYDIERGSFLVVYRLRDDGTSCIVGDTHDGNAAARAIADAARERFECQ
jgi:hypothetical protein